MRPIAAPYATLYAELLEQASMEVFPPSSLSFSRSRIKGKTYWYAELRIGETRARRYLGPDVPEVRSAVERSRAYKQEAKPSVEARMRLVATLCSAGLQCIGPLENRVLHALEQAGVFRAGGVLVGSHAFNAIGNMLGVQWNAEAARTQDIDIAGSDRISVGIRGVVGNLEQALLGADQRFIPVPPLNPRHASTSFRIRGVEIRVDLLTPMTGKPDGGPIRLHGLNAMAEPVRFLDYLLDDVQLGVLLGGVGVLVNLPAPGRYTLNKLAVSQRRPPAMQAKAAKDVRQADALIEVLRESRPGDLLLAADAAKAMPAKFLTQVRAGADHLSAEMRDFVLALLAP
jgi:hypothetical protein